MDEKIKEILRNENDQFKELEEKHPSPEPIQQQNLLHRPINEFQNTCFDNIIEELIRIAAGRTKSAVDP